MPPQRIDQAGDEDADRFEQLVVDDQRIGRQLAVERIGGGLLAELGCPAVREEPPVGEDPARMSS
jgi:hypothetical protein